MASHRVLPGALVALSGCLVAAGCSSSTGPHRAMAGVYIISGSGVSDTVFSTLPHPLVVEVRDSAFRTVPNQTVTFTAVVRQSAYPAGAFPSQTANQVVAVTDNRGQASAPVFFGQTSGAAAIALSAAGGGRVDTARYTVQPGRAVGIAAIPSDTAVYVGHTFTLRGGTVDQFGNVVSRSVGYSQATGGISISRGVVSGVQIGRGSYIVTGAVGGVSKTDTGWVSVVPPGVLAATDFVDIYIFNTDGSGFHRVLTDTKNSNPRWSPAGNEIAYDETLDAALGADVGGPDSVIHAVDTAGNVRVITSAAIGGVHQGPQYSRDGQWVYFARYPMNFDGNGGGSPVLWRVHPDGSAAAAVAVASSGGYAFPSPSPDGSQLAFETIVEFTAARVGSLTLGSGVVSTLSAVGLDPVWSPTTASIAFTRETGAEDNQGPLFVIAPDGSGQRQIGTAMYDPGVDWSPDGKWLVVHGIPEFQIMIVNVETGLRLPLAFLSTQLVEPTWRP